MLIGSLTLTGLHSTGMCWSDTAGASWEQTSSLSAASSALLKNTSANTTETEVALDPVLDFKQRYENKMFCETFLSEI